MATIRSAAWGNTERTLLTPHGLLDTWGGGYGYTAAYGMPGNTHPGVDVAMPVGTRLYALADGVVDYIREEDYPTGTKEIVIRTDSGDRHLYTHTSRRDVVAGQRVTAGQRIGLSGDPTGLPHLHFEHRVRDGGTSSGWRIVDPVPLLTGGADVTYHPSNPIAGDSRGKAVDWIAYFEDAGAARIDELAEYVETVYELAPKIGLGAHKVITQGVHETSTDDGPFTSHWWRTRLNPAGIGITGDPAQNDRSRVFPSGRSAALAQMVHMCLYVFGHLPEAIAEYRAEDPRADAIPATALGKRTTLESFGAALPTITWAADPKYGEKWARTLNALEPVFAGAYIPAEPEEPDLGEIVDDIVDAIEDSQEGGNGMAMIEHTLTHASRALYLPDFCPVQTKIVTHPRTTSRRKTGAKSRSTFHDTANPRTNAAAEWNWLAGGRQGGSLGGYNAIVDDRGVIYCGYLDEETWHAGTNSGNLTSWGTEFAFGGDVEWTPALENACAWHGALLEMGGLDPSDDFVWHQFWTGKYCPGQIFNRGLESVVRSKVAYYYNLARGARTGEIVPTIPHYADPVMPMVDGEPWDGTEDVTITGVKFEAQRVTATVTNGPLNRRQWASTQSQLTGPALETGTEVELLGWVAGELVTDISEWWIDTDGNRLWAGGFDVEPKIDPDWPIPPEEPTGIISVNGRPYYPLTDEDTGDLGRTITVHRDGNLYRWADTGSSIVGEVKAGEDRVFRYWTRGEELPLTLKNGEETIEGIWYAESIGETEGPRMWSGLSSERPD